MNEIEDERRVLYLKSEAVLFLLLNVALYVCTVLEPADKSDAASWQSDWMASSAHQSDESWAAFDQEVGVDQACGAELASGQWWPCSATKDTVDHSNTVSRLLTLLTPISLFLSGELHEKIITH